MSSVTAVDHKYITFAFCLYQHQNRIELSTDNVNELYLEKSIVNLIQSEVHIKRIGNKFINILI